MTDEKQILKELREMREQAEREREEQAARIAQLEAAAPEPLTPARARQTIRDGYAQIERERNGEQDGGDDDE